MLVKLLLAVIAVVVMLGTRSYAEGDAQVEDGDESFSHRIESPMDDADTQVGQDGDGEGRPDDMPEEDIAEEGE